jgi:hypothetical protein
MALEAHHISHPPSRKIQIQWLGRETPSAERYEVENTINRGSWAIQLPADSNWLSYQVLLASQTSSGEAWRSLLQRFDTDRDGMIDAEEFIAAGTRRFPSTSIHEGRRSSPCASRASSAQRPQLPRHRQLVRSVRSDLHYRLASSPALLASILASKRRGLHHVCLSREERRAAKQAAPHATHA